MDPIILPSLFGLFVLYVILEAVKDDQISRVLIAPDQGTAQVVENDGRRAQVNLAPDRELLGLLTEHNVDIAVQPSRQTPGWQQAAGSLIFPLLLLGGLFFLFRRAQGGGGGNDGDNVVIVLNCWRWW
mgnify:CR=1 FL=1